MRNYERLSHLSKRAQKKMSVKRMLITRSLPFTGLKAKLPAVSPKSEVESTRDF